MERLYSKIILATDLGPQSLYIGRHALKLGKVCGAELHVLHVVEPLMTYTANFSKHEADLAAAQTLATKSLNELCLRLGVDPSHRILKVGDPQNQILETSFNGHCDLIIVGSHGIGGYTHVLGSTVHNLLENAYCDVLVVQVRHLQEQIEAMPAHGEYLWKHLKEPALSKSPGLSQKPTQYGSEKGFGEVVRRGPRLTNRPPSAPYKGGTRTRTSEDEEGEV